MRVTALLLILGVAACATEPTAPSAQSPAPPPAPAAAAAAPPAAVAGAPSADTLKKARRLGLQPRLRQGTTMYCKDSANVGTRFETEHCYAAENLDDVVRQMEETQDLLRKSGACGSAACGSQ